MRDTFARDPLQDDMTPATSLVATSGLRHSIRPRRAVGAAPRPDTAPVAKAAPLSAPPVVSNNSGYLPDPSLPRWHELSQIETGARKKAGTTALPVVDATRESASVRAFDLLRTRLRQTTQEHGWTNIAITAPTSGCGTTFTAVNLALSLSRIEGSRTVLMDFNLRHPGIAPALDVTAGGTMRDFLGGHTPSGDHIVRISDTLALGLNSAPDVNASETLQAAETAHTLERMRAALQPELVIYDMPAMLTHDDVSAFLPHLDGVLLVSDGTQTMGRELMECEQMLDGQVPLLGVVLNRARANSIPRYN